MRILLSILTFTGAIGAPSFGHSQSGECETLRECAQQAVEAATQAKAIASILVPSGAIMAFALEECPTHWSEYELAYGRFLRGVDRNPVSTDEQTPKSVGEVQEDMIVDHSHNLALAVQSAQHAPGNKGTDGYGYGPYGTAVGGTVGVSGVHGGGSETRPKNVSVLFCRKE